MGKYLSIWNLWEIIQETIVSASCVLVLVMSVSYGLYLHGILIYDQSK